MSVKRLPRVGRKQTYPWRTWMNRSSFEIVRGVDYKGQTNGMIQMIRNRASKDGVTVSISAASVGGRDVITVQVNKGDR